MSLSILLLKGKIALSWLKKNSFAVLLFVGIVSLIIFNIMTRNQDKKLISSLQDQLVKSREDYEKAKELHQQEILRRQELERNYKKTVEDLKSKYNVDITALDKGKQDLVRQIITETNNNPSEIASRLTRELGIKVYEDIR